VMNALRETYPPEFLNRIDDMVIFNRLSRENMTGIVDVRIKDVEKLLEPRKISVTVTPEGRKWLADTGYDPSYGARPLNRVISKNIMNPMAKFILEGKIREGDNVTLSTEKAANGSEDLHFTKTSRDGQVTSIPKEEDKWA